MGLFTYADGRERVAIPFWNGFLSAVGSTAVGIAASLVGLLAALVVVILSTGVLPSTNPGHPLLALSELTFYIAGGAFAWWRLRSARRPVIGALDGRDVRTLLLAIAALGIVRLITIVQLVVTNETQHVQAGFEHFDVVTKQPNLTALTVTLAVLTLVVAGPIVEEMVFRGLLFGALAPRIGVVAGAVVSAVAFGAAHGDPVLFPSLAAFGFVAALAYAATGNLVVPMILHAVNNALGAYFLIAMSLHGR